MQNRKTNTETRALNYAAMCRGAKVHKDTDAEKRALKMATIYATICGANVPTSVLYAAVRNGTIARTAKGKIDKHSFARFLERLGYVGAAASFRRQYGLILSPQDRMLLEAASTERAAEKIEFRSFAMTAGGAYK